MRTGLRVAALSVWLIIAALWFFGGMNTGWTKTSVKIERFDEVTEQKYHEWQQRFLPGVEFLGAGLLLGGGLFGCSYLFSKK